MSEGPLINLTSRNSDNCIGSQKILVNAHYLRLKLTHHDSEARSMYLRRLTKWGQSTSVGPSERASLNPWISGTVTYSIRRSSLLPT